jgi:hypothetical protein
MAKYGITGGTKTVFYFGAYKYERLQDALNYVEKSCRCSKQLESSPNN